MSNQRFYPTLTMSTNHLNGDHNKIKAPKGSSISLTEQDFTQPLDRASLNTYNKRVQSLIIADEFLSDTPEKILLKHIKELENIGNTLKFKLSGLGVLNVDKSNVIDEQIKIKGWNLYELIEREISLYNEFINRGEELNLDSILNDDIALEDSQLEEELDSTYSQSIKGILSPLSPTITNTFSRRDDITNFSLNDHDNQLIKALFELNKNGLIEGEEESLIKWIELTHISNHLFNERIMEIAGRPTIFCVNKLITFATSRSLLVVFDFNQKIKWILGNTAVALEHGSISSIDLSKDGAWLIAGYSKGLIAVWDLIKGQIMTTILPVLSLKKGLLTQPKATHLKGSKVISLKFIGRTKRFLSGDDSGRVFHHSISGNILGIAHKSKLIYSTQFIKNGTSLNEDQTLFSFEILPVTGLNSKIEDMCLIALITPAELVIIKLKPKPDIILTISKKDLQSGVEAQFGKIESDFDRYGRSAMISWYPCHKVEQKVMDPLLAVGWGTYLLVLKVCVNQALPKSQNIEIFKAGQFQQDNPILSINWINQRNIILMDQREILYIIDINNLNSSTTIGSLTLYEPVLNYHQSFKKDEIEILPDYKYGLISYKNRLFVLGNKSFGIGLPLSWSDHVMGLINKGSAVEAILLSSHYLKEGPTFYFSQLPEKLDDRKMVMKSKLSALILASLNHLTSKWQNQTSNEVLIEVESFSKACVQACFELGELDLIFTTVHERLKDLSLSLSLFLAFEPYIVFPTPMYIDLLEDLPPMFIKDWIEAYSSHTHLLSRLEPILFHIDPLLLDLNQCVEICRNNHLIDGLIFLFSTAMVDFIAPIHELFNFFPSLPTNVKPEINVFSPDISTNIPKYESLKIHPELKEKLFDYLNTVTKGKSFPTLLPLSPQDHKVAMEQLSNFLGSEGLLNRPYDGLLKLPEVELASYSEGENLFGVYPYFMFICIVDLKSTIDILNNFENSLTSLQIESSFFESIKTPCLQLINKHQYKVRGRERYYLMAFLARLNASETIFLEVEVIESIFNELVDIYSEDFNLTFKERQEAMNEVIKSYQPKDIEPLLKAQYYKALKELFKRNHDAIHEFEISLKDKELHDDIFIILDTAHETLNLESKQKCLTKIKDNFASLVNINPKEAVRIAQIWFEDNHFELVHLLDGQLFLQYKYLCELLNINCLVTNELKLKYFELLCQFDPNSVLTFLKAHCEDSMIDDMLKVTKEFDITDGSVWILEKQENPLEAMNEILNILNGLFQAITSTLKLVHNKENDLVVERSSKIEIRHKIESDLLRIQGIVAIAAGLCDRTHSQSISKSFDELSGIDPINVCFELYYMLLNSLLMGAKLINEANGYEDDINIRMKKKSKEIFKTIVEEIFTSIINPTSNLSGSQTNSTVKQLNKISVPKLLSRVLESAPKNIEDESENVGVLGEFRDLLLSVLSTCSNEKTLLSLAYKVQSKDWFQVMKKSDAIRRKGLRGIAPRCIRCNNKLLDLNNQYGTDKVKIYHCGHISHFSCDNNNQAASCPKCN